MLHCTKSVGELACIILFCCSMVLRSWYTPIYASLHQLKSSSLVFMALSLLLFVTGCTSAQEGDWARVVRVSDGDTVWVQQGNATNKIRILGIDTPELHISQSGEPTNPDCYALEAQLFAEQTLLNQDVMLETDTQTPDTDVYDRLLRHIRLADGRDYSLMAIDQGYARVYRKTESSRLSEYLRHEREVQQDQVGLWGSCHL